MICIDHRPWHPCAPSSCPIFISYPISSNPFTPVSPFAYFSLFGTTLLSPLKQSRSQHLGLGGMQLTARVPSPKMYFNEITYSFLFLIECELANYLTKCKPSSMFLRETLFSSRGTLLILNKQSGMVLSIISLLSSRPLIFLTNIPNNRCLPMLSVMYKGISTEQISGFSERELRTHHF